VMHLDHHDPSETSHFDILKIPDGAEI